MQPLTYFNFARDVLDYWASARPEALALWCVDESGRNEQKFSFRQLAEDHRRAAGFFHAAGIGRGERVLVILPRVPQWWLAILGLTRLGAVPIPGTPLLTARDIRYRVEAADARAILTDAEGAAKVEGFKGARLLAGAERPGWTNFDAGLREASPEFECEPTRSDEPGIIYFTSGTTGPPKMVLHTQASYGLGHRATGELWLDLKPEDVHWCLTDTGWAKAAWSCLFGPWQRGACVFAMDWRDKFDSVA